MPYFNINENQLEIHFNGIPPENVRQRMKDIGIWYNPDEDCWKREATPERIVLAQKLCIHRKPPQINQNYGLKIKIKDIVRSDTSQQEKWRDSLTAYVKSLYKIEPEFFHEDAVSTSQENVWLDCFRFIKSTFCKLSDLQQEYELVFEYFMPGTAYERPDVLLITYDKVIILEFKKKEYPKEKDFTQIQRYQEWIKNHHQITKDAVMDVIGYLVCTADEAKNGSRYSIPILNRENAAETISKDLSNTSLCPGNFIRNWLSSPKSEMEETIGEVEKQYQNNNIFQLSKIYRRRLKKLNQYISSARNTHRKRLILIDSAPGANLKKFGESIVFEQNKNRKAEAVYLTGNAPLAEVLQGKLNQTFNVNHAGENFIQKMRDFKVTYYYHNSIPEQSVFVFDETQNLRDEKNALQHLDELEVLFQVGDKIAEQQKYAVIIGLLEDHPLLSYWQETLKNHPDWKVFVPPNISNHFSSPDLIDIDLFLPIPAHADLPNSVPFAEALLQDNNFHNAKKKLRRQKSSSMKWYVSRDFQEIRRYTAWLDREHANWTYGLLVSNFADASILSKKKTGWDLGYGKKSNTVQPGKYFDWFHGTSKKLQVACNAYGCQELTFDCPIIVWGGDLLLQDNKWVTCGYLHDKHVLDYVNIDTAIRDNYRVLLTRATKQNILFLPNIPKLDETYQYFLDLGGEFTM